MASGVRALMLAGFAGALFFGGGGPAESAPSPAGAPCRRAESPLSGPIPIQAPALPPASGGTAAADLQTIVDAALADASRRTGIPVSRLVIASAEPVVWADGSLGCPMPGTAYTMALVPGFRVRIRVGETMLDYHAGGRQLILCPRGQALDPMPVQSR